MRTLQIVILLGLTLLSFATCAQPSPSTPAAKPSTKPSPGSDSELQIAYLFDGKLWTITISGENRREMLSVGPEESIDEFLWSRDGKVLFVALGSHLLSVTAEDGKRSELGTLAAPTGTTIDGLEASRDGESIIVQTFDADAVPHLYSFSLERKETRELTIDDYSAQTSVLVPKIRRFSDLSVSPEVTRVLFKDAVGSNEQLFTASLETGARMRLTALEQLDGFEESAEAAGGRSIIEADWSPDGRFVLFNPAQSCSESGLCYGQLFLTNSWTGQQLRLSQEMRVGIGASWDARCRYVLFVDDGKITVSDPLGQTKALAEGSRPKWRSSE